MADIPHRVGNAADSVSVSASSTSFIIQVKAISGVKVRGRFLIHALDTASNNTKSTVYVVRGYGDSAGNSLTPTIQETEDDSLTVPISAKDSTGTTPSGTAVVVEKFKVFTQGQWLTDEHVIRGGETLTLVVENEDSADAITYYVEWKGE